MKLVIISLLGFIIVFCFTLTWFIYINKASPRLLEMLTPIVGAILISTAWGLKLIYNNAPESIDIGTRVINVEYVNGGQLPITIALTDKPFLLHNYDVWTNYLYQWNSVFLNKRTSAPAENTGNAEPVHFEFFEYFVLKTISERFGLGWNFNSSSAIITPWGTPAGGGSYGVLEEQMDKIFLKQKMDLNNSPNRFILNDTSDAFYQLAIPKGSTVEIKREPLSFQILIMNPRFKLSLEFEMYKSIFTANGFTDYFIYPVLNQLFLKLGKYGNANKVDDIRFRQFEVSLKFEQNIFSRFNEIADLDKKFAENLWSYVPKSLSWSNIEMLYQEAANH